MADLLEQGAVWLDDQRHQHMTRTVVYERGVDSVQLAATIGRTEFKQVDEFGIVHKIESRDYLLRTTDLVLASVQTLPKAGDRVRETDGATTFVYEVMAPGHDGLSGASRATGPKGTRPADSHRPVPLRPLDS